MKNTPSKGYRGPQDSADPHFHVRGVPVYGDAILSPMDGYSDQPFRSLCRELGSAMSYTEFVKVDDILTRAGYVEEKLTYTGEERPLVFQIYGDDPQMFLEAALKIRERNPDIIDINMGCPAKTISARGAGVGLMRTPDKIAEIFSLLTKNLDIPITGKIRLGWDEENRNYLEVAKVVEDNGGQLLAVHGRTKKQGYGGEADWDAIAEIVDALSIPVIGNGDVNTVADIQRMKDHTGCAGVMVARASMSNPWIFSGLDREDVPTDVLRDTMVRHLELNLGFYGAERGIVLFRKFAARYLTPYRLPKEIRKRLLTCEVADEFVRLLDEIVGGRVVAEKE
jgi:nifR3 family TIM-barrel protein